jgi:hypothetical protein
MKSKVNELNFMYVYNSNRLIIYKDYGIKLYNKNNNTIFYKFLTILKEKSYLS